MTPRPLPTALLLLAALALPTPCVRAESSPYPVLPPNPLTARIRGMGMTTLGRIALRSQGEGGTPPYTFRWDCKPVVPGDDPLFPLLYRYEVLGPPAGDNSCFAITPPPPGTNEAWRVIATDSKGVKAASLEPFVLYAPPAVSIIPASGGDPESPAYDPGGECGAEGVCVTPRPIGVQTPQVTK